MTVDAVTVSVTDNDTAGVTIVASAPINVVEGGTGTYTVVLASQPSASVAVTPTSGNESAVTVPPTVLTFTTGDWAYSSDGDGDRGGGRQRCQRDGSGDARGGLRVIRVTTR